MADVIRFGCQGCGKPVVAPAKAAGQRAKCPKCGNPLLVPGAAERKRAEHSASRAIHPPTVDSDTPMSKGDGGSSAVSTVPRASPAKEELSQKSLLIGLVAVACVAVLFAIGGFAIGRSSTGPGSDAGAGVPLLQVQQHEVGERVTSANFLRIRTGMNHQEVTLILGEPTERIGAYPNPRIWKWRDSGRVITAVIDRDGNVEAKTEEGLTNATTTLLPEPHVAGESLASVEAEPMNQPVDTESTKGPTSDIDAEKRTQLQSARETVRFLVEKDRQMRQTLPALMREAELEIRAKYPGEQNFTAKAKLQAVREEFLERKLKWRNLTIAKTAEIGGALIKLRQKYGMEDEALAQDVKGIMEGLEPLGEPWPY